MISNQEIVNRFLRDGQFYTLPAKRNKLMLVLQYILENFEMDKSYTEAEVNRIIEQYFGDFCRVRRAFIDERMMTRKDGIYHRI